MTPIYSLALGWLTDAVVQRARDVLHQLESGESSGRADSLVDDLPLFSAAVRREQPAPPKVDTLAEAIAALNPDELTPKQALEALYRLRHLAGNQ